MFFEHPHLLLSLLLGGLILGLVAGYPVAFVLFGISCLVGYLCLGTAFFSLLILRVFETMHNYILVSIILFIFMGIMLERSGAAEKLFSAMHILLGGLKGGLALATIIVCTIMAAATGIMGAPVIIMGLFALPEMLKRGYDPGLSCGTICAGGTLGILIPPSIMLVVYGPMAGLSVGQLFLGAILPGLLLSLLYILYILIRCHFQPSLAPALPCSERQLSWKKKIHLVLTSLLPTLLLIIAVLGSIFFGIAAPTEAAAVGALASLFLALAYGRLTWKNLQQTLLETLEISSMILFIVAGAFVFTGTFMIIGGGELVKQGLLALPIGRWGILALMTGCFFIFGLFMEWIGIVPILVPIFTPVLKDLGFDPLWAALIFCVAMQTSFLTPPMAPALFYLKGVAPKEIRFSQHIVKGALPFIAIQILGLICLALFPNIILYLPHLSH